MIAILSDIHANLEALHAVLEDIAKFNVEAIYCLGDLVGYGPDPIPCVQQVMQWEVLLIGNHEQALLSLADELDRYPPTLLTCYVLYSPEVIEYRRIEYDVERTVAKLRNEPDGDLFGQRLREAR